jgi:hypothetical protein
MIFHRCREPNFSAYESLTLDLAFKDIPGYTDNEKEVPDKPMKHEKWQA